MTASSPNGGEREFRARLVVGADGKDSAVAKCAEMATRRFESSRFGCLAHFRNLPLRCAAGSARPGSWNRTWRTRSPMTTG